MFLGATLLAVAGCSDVNKPQNQQDVESVSVQVRSLQTQVHSLQRENQEYKQQIEAFKAQVERQQKDALQSHVEYQKALSSPGYEAAFRLVYSRLQEGDMSLLRSLVSAEREIEAGFMLEGTSTFRPYKSASELDLRPYTIWADEHPSDQAQFEVFARIPGYAWVHAHFPDGTRFSLFFEETSVVKIVISDQPFDFT